MSKEQLQKWDFSSRLNSFESVVLRIVAGNAFHATGPQTEKARSPWSCRTSLLIFALRVVRKTHDVCLIRDTVYIGSGSGLVTSEVVVKQT